jgi:5-methylcytosine-specific restriction endonuclease McrA
MTTMNRFARMSDGDLLDEIRCLAATERGVKAELIRALGEADARRLYLGQGCSSLFAYCTRVLHLSEHAAYGRIEAARCARRFPAILDLLQAGDINLTTVTLLARHLTDDNHHGVLEEARHRSRRDVERIVARLRPQPDVAPCVRKLPEPPARPAPAMESPAATVAVIAPDASVPERRAAEPASVTSQMVARPVMRPLSPTRYSLKLTIGEEVHDMLGRAQALLRHAVPDGDLAVVFERALRALLRELERTRLAAATRPRAAVPSVARSRHVPASVRRAVWKRDEGRCACVGADGRRCDATAFLELHHLVPFADGGQSTVENLVLHCKSHNGYEADRWFGPMRVKEELADWDRADAKGAFGRRSVSGAPCAIRQDGPYEFSV